MSNRSYLGLGGLLCAGFIAVTGCSSGDAEAAAIPGEYNTAALDVYMSDANENVALFSEKHSKKSHKSNAKSSRKSERNHDKSMADMFSMETKPCDHAGVEPHGIFGDWVGDINMDDAMASSPSESHMDSDVDPAMAEMGEEMAKAMAEMMSSMFSMSLCLKEDHSFSAQMVMMPIEGTWKQKGERIMLIPKKIMGFTEEDAKSMKSKMEESFKDANGMNMEVTSTDFEPLELRVIEGGNALAAINPNSGEDQALVFRRK